MYYDIFRNKKEEITAITVRLDNDMVNEQEIFTDNFECEFVEYQWIADTLYSIDAEEVFSQAESKELISILDNIVDLTEEALDMSY